MPSRLIVLMCDDGHRWWGGAMKNLAVGDACLSIGCPHALRVDPNSPHNARNKASDNDTPPLGGVGADPVVFGSDCPMTLILGIDPGASGAIAALNGHGLVNVIDMPHHDGRVAPALVASHLRDLIDDNGLVVAYVEDVHSMPKQGVSSSFKFGMAHGTVLGVLGALHVPVHLVSATKWKRHLGLSSDKDQSRRRACELWPDAAGQFARKKDDGRAEAALIALYGQQTSNTPTPRSIP